MTPAAARAMYRAQLVSGDTVSLVRGFGTTAAAQVDGLPVRMLKASELLVAGLMQGERVLLLLAEDVDASPLGAPMVNDRVLWSGRPLAVRFVDDTKRRVGGELIAYELYLAGA